MSVLTVAGNHLVFGSLDRLHANHHGFLTDVEVTEAADQTHAVELARALLEPADEEHGPVEVEQLSLVGSLHRRRGWLFSCFRGAARHARLQDRSIPRRRPRTNASARPGVFADHIVSGIDKA